MTLAGVDGADVDDAQWLRVRPCPISSAGSSPDAEVSNSKLSRRRRVDGDTNRELGSTPLVPPGSEKVEADEEGHQRADPT